MIGARSLLAADGGATARMLRDLAALTKPRIVLMNTGVALGGMALARGRPSLGLAVAALVGTALAVGAANALNMVLDRDCDALMERTRARPLPAGRLSVGIALGFGLVLGLGAIALLWWGANPLTALLAALAIDTYVLLYTPLKRVTHRALWVGAVPGALPALLGWTTVTGSIALPGLALFAILLFWQVAHAHAIALYRKNDYAHAGLHVLPLAVSDAAARLQARLATITLVPASLALPLLGVAGRAYVLIVLATGAGLIAASAVCLTERAGPSGARRFFHATLLYMGALCLALVVNRVLR